MATIKFFGERFLQRVLLVVVALILGLLVGEGICRILFEPVDYLAPELMEDDALGIRIKPRSAGR